jgi:hypothetical protein
MMATKPARVKSANRPAAGRFATVVEDARRAGLLDGDKSEHVSFRAPPALI